MDSFLAYLKTERGASGHTLKNYRRDLEELASYLKRVHPRLFREGEPDWEALDVRVLRGYTAELLKKNRTSSVGRKLSTLKSFYNFCVKKGLLPSNPARLIPSPKKPKLLPRFLSVDEANGLMEEVGQGEKKSKTRDRAILELLYGCGLRVSELASLSLGDFDVSERVLRVQERQWERIVPVEKRPHSSQGYLNERLSKIPTEGPFSQS